MTKLILAFIGILSLSACAVRYVETSEASPDSLGEARIKCANGKPDFTINMSSEEYNLYLKCMIEELKKDPDKSLKMHYSTTKKIIFE